MAAPFLAVEVSAKTKYNEKFIQFSADN